MTTYYRGHISGKNYLILVLTAVVITFLALFILSELEKNEIVKEKEQLEKEISENETTRSGGLEVSLEKPELQDKFVPSEEDPSFFPLAYNRYLRETSPFSARISPITGELVKHLGWDICGRPTGEVFAAGSGKITDIWIPKGTVINGLVYRGHETRDGYIEIDHGRVITTYSHLSEVYVYNIGAIVEEGQVIGRTGAGGLSTGDHLHFEAIHKETGEYFDPVELFPYVFIDENHRIWFDKKQENPVSTF